ncbi:MAG: hypothetical protein GEU82_06100 [Luteitalea sp.]|nr:hypothetical protein [Luteitalea sp.]
MPYLRFSRDKRGYEHTYLVHESGGRGRASRARVLYWFRTPPGIKVGRDPFDEDARRRIESNNPGLSFDWNAIVSTPKPPIPEVERWRERRRVERAAKVARREEEQESEGADSPPELTEEAVALVDIQASGASEPAEGSAERMVAGAPGADDPPRKRRRRRGGRHRTVGEPPATPVPGRLAPGVTSPHTGARTDASEAGGPSEPTAPDPTAHDPSGALSETSRE